MVKSPVLPSSGLSVTSIPGSEGGPPFPAPEGLRSSASMDSQAARDQAPMVPVLPVVMQEDDNAGPIPWHGRRRLYPARFGVDDDEALLTEVDSGQNGPRIDQEPGPVPASFRAQTQAAGVSLPQGLPASSGPSAPSATFNTGSNAELLAIISSALPRSHVLSSHADPGASQRRVPLSQFANPEVSFAASASVQEFTSFQPLPALRTGGGQSQVGGNHSGMSSGVAAGQGSSVFEQFVSARLVDQASRVESWAHYQGHTARSQVEGAASASHNRQEGHELQQQDMLQLQLQQHRELLRQQQVLLQQQALLILHHQQLLLQQQKQQAPQHQQHQHALRPQQPAQEPQPGGPVLLQMSSPGPQESPRIRSPEVSPSDASPSHPGSSPSDASALMLKQRAAEAQGIGSSPSSSRQEQTPLMPADLRGTLSDNWMALGLELWERGITMGTDRFTGEERETHESQAQAQEGHEQLDPTVNLNAEHTGPGQAQGVGWSGVHKQEAASPDGPSTDKGVSRATEQGSEARTEQGAGSGSVLAQRLAAAIGMLQSQEQERRVRRRQDAATGAASTSLALRNTGQPEELDLHSQIFQEAESTGYGKHRPVVEPHLESLATHILAGMFGGGGALGSVASATPGAPHLVTRLPGRGDTPTGRTGFAKGLLKAGPKASDRLGRPSMPRPVGLGTEGVTKRNLLLAAEMLHRNDMASFRAICNDLRAFARKRGTAAERIAYHMLLALEHRAAGTGLEFINKPLKRTIQDLENARMWYYTACPFIPMAILAFHGLMLPKLMGKSRVHVVNIGEIMLPQFPGLIRLLKAHSEHSYPGGCAPAQQAGLLQSPPLSQPQSPGEAQAPAPTRPSSQSPPRSQGSLAVEEWQGKGAGRVYPGQQQWQSQGAGPVHSEQPARGPLEHVRITDLNSWPLGRPGRKDLHTMRSPGRVAAYLGQAADALGVPFEFQRIDLSDHSLQLLQSIERRPGETLVVCSGFDMKFLNDGPKGVGVFKLMQCLSRLRPDLVCFAEENLSACQDDFLQRYSACLDFHWTALDAHDAAITPATRRLLYTFEEMYQESLITGIVACDGRTRKMSLSSRRDWEGMFAQWGFRPHAVKHAIVDAAHEMLKCYPSGYGLLYDGYGMRLTWKGDQTMFVAAWTS